MAHETASLRDQASAAQAAQDSAEAALASTQAELAQAHERCRAAERDLSQCTAKVQELVEQNRLQKQTVQHLEQQCQQLQTPQRRAGAIGPQRQRSGRTGFAAPRHRAGPGAGAGALAQRRHPGPNSDRGCAVAARRPGTAVECLERPLRSRKRPATAGEHALLQAALDWHNHNWRTRPYRLIEAPASTYHFDHHLRSRHASTGETISAQHLPGIADGSGRPLCKALVHTQ